MQLRLTPPPLSSAAPKTNSEPLSDRLPYRREINGAKGSIFYRAHSYHTKVPPEGIAPVIEHYTNPGDWVLDPFCGSGMTGVACLMTGRRGLLSDLSPAAVHIASNYVRPTDAVAFDGAVERLLSRLRAVELDLYGRTCPDCHGHARIEYTVWSDVFGCPACQTEMVFWSAGLDAAGSVSGTLTCPGCSRDWQKRQLHWQRSTPVLQSISCERCRGRVEHVLSPDEQAAHLARDRAAIPSSYPTTIFEASREMWRGQHRDQGIETAADFFTTRNLWGLAVLRQEIVAETDEALRSALTFLFTSIINRASRRYQWNPKRPTNVLTSTMYVSSLSYEFNVFSLLRRKARTIGDLYRTTDGMRGRSDVALQPAQSLVTVPDSSVHYVFTDPPFGSNIFYADSSFLWEAWLGAATDMSHEAVVNKSVKAQDGGKSLTDYEKLMTGAFEEINRVLRQKGWASVMFHNSDDRVWSALERAVENAGFEVGAAVAFDKHQASFKGIKGLTAGERVANFDLVLHLTRTAGRRQPTTASDEAVLSEVVARLNQHLTIAPAAQRTTPYLHSLVMRILLEAGWPLSGFSYRGVERLCESHFNWDGKAWKLPTAEAPGHGQVPLWA